MLLFLSLDPKKTGELINQCQELTLSSRRQHLAAVKDYRKLHTQDVAYSADDLECPLHLMVPQIHSEPLKSGNTNSIWVSCAPQIPHGASCHTPQVPSTSCGAELQWSYASLLASFPFHQHSLWNSTPQRAEAGDVCTDRPARESINDNLAHCTRHPPAWRG